jgi:hypothetical protein
MLPEKKKALLLIFLAPALLASGLFGASLCIIIFSPPVFAQDYNYRGSGGSRVIQNSNGLPNPSSTYITRGTLSPSAQVPVYGSPSPVNSGLPSGAIKYPGRDANGNPVAQPSNQTVPGLPVARMGSTVGTPGDYMRSDLNPNFTYQQKNNPQQVRYIRVGPTPQRKQNSTQALTYPGTAPRQANRSSSSSGRYVPPAQYSSDQNSNSFKGY